MPSIAIDVFSDPACPWCLVGLARLDNAIATLPDDVDVAIAHHPFLLDVSTPDEGVDVRELLRRKYGREPDANWDRLEAAAAESGLALNMRAQKTRYASQKLLALIAAAVAKGTQHKLARAMSDAYYLEARNMSDPEVLSDIAGAHGFTQDEVLAIISDQSAIDAITDAAASVSAQGIQGVPFFVFDGQFALSGAQPEAVFTQAFEKVLEGSPTPNH